MTENTPPPVTPDYSFITNQNFGAPTPGSDRSFRNKLIILVGLFVIIVIATIGLVVSTNKKVNQSNNDVVGSHMNAIASGDVTGSKQYYHKSNEVDDAIYKAIWEGYYSKKIDFKNCIKMPESTQVSGKSKYYCSYTGGSSGEILVYTLNQGSGLIERVDYERNASNG